LYFSLKDNENYTLEFNRNLKKITRIFEFYELSPGNFSFREVSVDTFFDLKDLTNELKVDLLYHIDLFIIFKYPVWKGVESLKFKSINDYKDYFLNGRNQIYR
jgi:hypothetical protein